MDEFKQVVKKKIENNFSEANKLNTEYLDSNYKLMILQNHKINLENSYLHDQISNLLKENDELKRKIKAMKDNAHFNQIINSNTKENNDESSRQSEGNKINEEEKIISKQANENIKQETKADKCKQCNFIVKIKDKEMFYLKAQCEKNSELYFKYLKLYNEVNLIFNKYTKKYSFLISKIDEAISKFIINNKLCHDPDLIHFQEIFDKLDNNKKQELIENILKLLLPMSISHSIQTNEYNVFTTEINNVYERKRHQITKDTKDFMKLRTSLPNLKSKVGFTNSNIASVRFYI